MVEAEDDDRSLHPLERRDVRAHDLAAEHLLGDLVAAAARPVAVDERRDREHPQLRQVLRLVQDDRVELPAGDRRVERLRQHVVVELRLGEVIGDRFVTVLRERAEVAHDDLPARVVGDGIGGGAADGLVSDDPVDLDPRIGGVGAVRPRAHGVLEVIG